MDEQDYKSLILYYGREKFFHSMQSKSIEALSKFPANPCFRLYNGFALVLGNRIQEGKKKMVSFCHLKLLIVLHLLV